ncbi:YidC/Oxa1 family membrane protein insertase [Chloroflexota bacterium]
MEFFNLIFLDPVLNILIVITNFLGGNFGLAIIALTLIVRLAILPLTMRQLRASKKMTDSMRELQPKIQQIQKKYAKDKQKLFKEQQKLFKEAGVNPMGCLTSPMLVTMIIQMPIFIALYRAIIQAVAVTPQDFLGLSDHLYSWSIVHETLPVSGEFLWLHLGSPDPYFLIPILVTATMWVSQKMMTSPSGSNQQQQSMQGMMQIMMPLMFGFITFTLPSGLGLYFLVTSVISIVTQYRIYGWSNLKFSNPFNRLQPKQLPEKK